MSKNFTNSKTDVTNEYSTKDKKYIFSINEKTFEFFIEFGCKKQGNSKFKLIMIPLNPYNPFEPVINL